MPSVEYDTKDLMNLLGREYDLDKLRETVPMLGVDLESADAESFCVEVFPNRPDMLSIEGFARALRGFLGIETGLAGYDVCESDCILYVDPSVEDVRPCVGTGIVKDIKLDDDVVKSIMDMQEKLHLTHGRNRAKVSIGVHDLDRVEPPFTYKAVEPGSISFVPLEMDVALDLAQILRKHPKGRDYAWILDGCDRYPVFVDKNDDVLSFPPIINGELTKLTKDTTNIFLDLTGTDQYAVDIALNIVACALSDRGGKIESVKVKKL